MQDEIVAMLETYGKSIYDNVTVPKGYRAAVMRLREIIPVLKAEIGEFDSNVLQSYALFGRLVSTEVLNQLKESFVQRCLS